MSQLDDATTGAGGPRIDVPARRGDGTGRTARTGRDAVVAAARAACGDGAVESAAVADGLALAGRRAAVLFPERHGDPSPTARAAWVLHRVGEAGPTSGFAVELHAVSAEEAVDHVLAAQFLVAATGRAVACTLDSAAASRVSIVRLPDAPLCRAALDAAPRGNAAPDETAILAACDAAAAVTGAPVGGRVRAGNGTVRAITWNGRAHVLADEPPATADAGSTGPGDVVVVGASPAGAGADRFVLDLAAMIETATPLRFARRSLARDVALWEIGTGDARGDGEIDVLLLAGPAWLRRTDVLDRAREGATVVVLQAPDDPDAALAALPKASLERLRERKLTVRWSSADGADRVRALGAALGAAAPLHRLGDAADPVQAVAAGRSDDEAARLLAGRDGVRQTEDVPDRPAAREQDFTPRDERPREPRVPDVDEATATSWRDRIRRWHVGAGVDPADAPSWPVPAAMPAAVAALGADPGVLRHGGPIVLLAGDDGPEGRSLRCFLRDRLGERLSDFPMLSERLDLIALAASRAFADAALSPVARGFDDLAGIVRRGLEVSPAGEAARDAEIDRLRDLFPADAVALRTDAGAPLAAYLHVVRADRAPRRRGFDAEIDRLRARLREILDVDDGHAAATPDGLGSSVGDLASTFLDTGRLSKDLGARRGPKSLPADRRSRIESCLARLDAAASARADADEIVVVHDGSLPTGTLPEGVRAVDHPRPLDVAAGLFDGKAEAAVDLFRAARIARLEAEGVYDPALHDGPLARLDARRLSAEELYVLPTVAVWLRPERVARGGLAELSALLRSGRPVHVLVPADPLAADEGAAFATHATGLGYVAAAHREAFVLESTLDRPRHLVRGLRRMVSVLRPGAAVVAVPPHDERAPAIRGIAALAGRASVCFRYDAAAGVTWADRFDLDGNPQPERPWPRYELSYLDASGEPRTRSEAVTWAHAAALDAGRRGEFLPIPPAAWSDEQVEISEWTRLADAERRRSVPYLWLVEEDGTLARAVVSRRLAEQTEDRMRAWRTLQELAGTDNAHARRAAEAARADALAEAEALRAALLEEKDEEIERARTGAAAEAMDRLVQSLMNLDALPSAAALAPPPSRAAETAPAPAEETGDETAEAAPAVEEEEEELLEEPYVDSVLCTSCQECINLNPKLFRYDGNKQAFIADAAAGTFEELVKAAEKCPARCIHPGAPRPGDGTATDEMVARAAKFN